MWGWRLGCARRFGVALIDSRGRIDQWRAATAPETQRSVRLDFSLLRKAFFCFGAGVLVVAPFTRDPLITAACGAVPYALVLILDRVRMPSIVVFYLLFMWLEMAARLVLTALDEEALGDSVYGTDVCRAMWYAMASLIVLALVLRTHLGRSPARTAHALDTHLRWPPLALFQVYLGAAGFAFILAPLARLSGGLAQPVQALEALKYVAIFTLFATVLSTRYGYKLLLLVVLVEIAIGFTGLFSGFKTILIVLLLTGLSLRMTLRIPTIAGIAAAFSALVVLLLFWTAVKSEYREYATGYSDTQTIAAGLGDRARMLIDKALHPEEIEWGLAIDGVVRRIAYIDFFGATIGVVENAPEEEFLPRWRDALEHVAKPRILFPNKPSLDDTEVFLRYVRDEVGDDSRPGTSISIGYLAENFIDFGFPLMLIPVGVMGLVLSCAIRYFMTRPVPWAVREGLTMALILTLGTGMELSLAKFLGGLIMVTGVLGLCVKFLYPVVERWLERRRVELIATGSAAYQGNEAVSQESVG